MQELELLCESTNNLHFFNFINKKWGDRSQRLKLQIQKQQKN